MIIEQHYDEEVLAEFLAEPTESVARDKHLASCALCMKTLDSLRGSARILAEPAVWDRSHISPDPRPDTLAFLRNVQKTMADEDTTAAVWIKQLLAGPRETWAPRLEEHPAWRTGGMVRRLLAAVEDAVSKVPEDAEAMALLAIQIAEASQDASSVMRRLYGLSWYHRAYALWYTGKINEALESVDHADAALSNCIAVDLDLARVSLMRAMIYQMLERRDEALSLADRAVRVFAEFGDHDRVAAARSLSAITLQESQRYREAARIHQEIVEMPGIAERWRVSAVSNLALCHQALGDLSSATQNLLTAIEGYERLGMMTFRSKSRWALADVFAQQGKHEHALAIYSEVRTEFAELGMWNDVALASLDAAEILVALGRAAEISQICRAAIDYFVENGLGRTEPALRGLAYLNEAAASGRATKTTVEGVRAYLLEPASAASLLFAPLPE